jgi:putative oxidoreductase
VKLKNMLSSNSKLAIILGLAMVIFGADKIFHFMPMPELTPAQIAFFGNFMAITWLRPLVAIGEILGGLALIYPKTRALGAVMLFPILLGILSHNLTMDMSGIVMGGPLFAILAWIIYDNRAKYMPMISSSAE